MNIELSDKTAAFLTELVRRLDTQSNHGTADPYYYTVRCTKDRAVPHGCGDGEDHYHYDGTTFTEEELKNFCEENDENFETMKDRCDKFSMEEVNEYENVFLTEEGYNEHMKLNSHNYRHWKSYQFYVLHAFRNPEMTGLIEAVKEIGQQLKGVSIKTH